MSIYSITTLISHDKSLHAGATACSNRRRYFTYLQKRKHLLSLSYAKYFNAYFFKQKMHILPLATENRMNNQSVSNTLKTKQ